MVKKVYEFQPGDLVTALFYDASLNRINWRWGLAVKMEKFHRRDKAAQRVLRVYWGQNPAYSMVNMRVLNEWTLASYANDTEKILSIHEKHGGGCFVKTTYAIERGQLSNPMLDSTLTHDLRMHMYDVVSGLSDPRSNAQIELDKILESHFTHIETGV